MKKMNLKLFFTPGTDAGSYEVNPVNVTSQTTTGKDMSPTMKDFYDTYLLENAREAMVFTQLGKKEPIHGNTVEWRKFNTFKKALTPLTEGVIPTGENFGMTKITASTTQHGSYVSISDRLELEAYDDVILGATEEMGAAEGETFDTLTRNILVAGNSVVYAPTVSGGTETAVTSRLGLDKTAILSSKVVDRAATWLKKNKAPKIDGSYVAVIHPSQSYDLREEDGWLDVHKYADVKPIFNGEIGSLHGVRFIESTATKIFCGADATATSRTLSNKTAISSSTTTVAVNEAVSADEATALAGRTFIDASGNKYVIQSATSGAAGSASLTLKTAITSLAKDAVLYPGEGGKDGLAVYAALFLGKDAFAVIDPEGEGMEMIIKDRATAGGPLNQFSTIGYKFSHGAKILYQERMLRVETGSYYSDVDVEN